MYCPMTSVCSPACFSTSISATSDLAGVQEASRYRSSGSAIA